MSYGNQPFNGLTDAQAERLAILLGELGEAQQAIGKILQHGYESTNPDLAARATYLDGEQVWVKPTNRNDLERELGDVQAAVDLLIQSSDLNANRIFEAECAKREKQKRWTHHQ